ncbi:hypothetical protein [Arachidicoccus terrestris]|uniref:hypothetical protein n=1 Tax=Arachidicoccus terrestris TaxID=2875539 RepID=UPI001CC47A5D|nr:hypothetical protein [Arachidicoccus terrestris]UAY56383.1 hypothetical protein K9M52_05045 [Arachidicoccus terrestris]
MKYLLAVFFAIFFICCNKRSQLESRTPESELLYSPLNNAYMNSEAIELGSTMDLNECWRKLIKEQLIDSTSAEAIANYLACRDYYFENYVPPTPHESSGPELPTSPDNGTPVDALQPLLPFTDSASCVSLLSLISPEDFSILNQAVIGAFNANGINFFHLSTVDRFEAILNAGNDIPGYVFEPMFLFFHESNGNYIPFKSGSNPMANIAYLHSISIESAFPPSILDDFYPRPINPAIITEFPLKTGEPLPERYWEYWGPYKVLIDNSVPSDDPGAVPVSEDPLPVPTN